MITTETVGNVLLYFTTAGALTAVVLYSRVLWWSGWAGRANMVGMVALASVTLTVSIRNLFGPFPGYDVLRLVAFGLVGVGVWFQVVVLIKLRRTAERRPEEEKERGYHGRWQERR